MCHEKCCIHMMHLVRLWFKDYIHYICKHWAYARPRSSITMIIHSWYKIYIIIVIWYIWEVFVFSRYCCWKWHCLCTHLDVPTDNFIFEQKLSMDALSLTMDACSYKITSSSPLSKTWGTKFYWAHSTMERKISGWTLPVPKPVLSYNWI